MMSNERLPLRLPPVETDEHLLARMGIDAEAWASEYMKMPHDRERSEILHLQLTAWFHNAIKAGAMAERTDRYDAIAAEFEPPLPPATAEGLSDPFAEDARPASKRVIDASASGTEMRMLAISARAAISHLRKYIWYADADSDALSRASELLGQIVTDPCFSDAGEH